MASGGCSKSPTPAEKARNKRNKRPPTQQTGLTSDEDEEEEEAQKEAADADDSSDSDDSDEEPHRKKLRKVASDSEQEEGQEAVGMKLRKRREEEDVITAVLYDDEEEVWKAKYAVDRGVYTIDFGSLDAKFMQDTIGRCKRKRRKWVPIPQGRQYGSAECSDPAVTDPDFRARICAW